jgi:hypothetical protein
MIKNIILVTSMALGFSASACTITAEDLQDALKLPEVTAETKSVFAAAISEVTLQVVSEAITVAQEVTSAVQAPASFVPNADGTQTLNVNKTVTKEGGGQIVITGTVTGTGTQASGTVTVDLKAVWTDLPVEGSTLKTSGSQTLKGTMGWDSEAAEDKSFTLDVDVVGSFVLNGETFAFDVVVTMDGGKFTFSGNVNGQTVSGNQTVTPPTRAVEGAPVAACVYDGESEACWQDTDGNTGCNTYNYQFCIEYTDVRWTTAQITEHCSWAKSKPTNCPTEGLLGRCKQLKDGLAYSYYSYSADDTTQADCLEDGGTWEGNN